MSVLARRLIGFSALPLISSLTPLLLLPIVARLGGAEGWASVAIGQSVGAVGSVIIGYGSMIWGPPAIAAAHYDEQKATYIQVASFKALVSFLVLPLTTLLILLMCGPRYWLEAVGMGISMSLVGWSPAWYFIGQGKPGPIASFETVPKLIATGIAAVLLLITGVIWVYPLCLIVATAIGLSLFHRRFFGRVLLPVSPFNRATLLFFRARLQTALVEATGTAYIAAPVPVISFGGSVSEVGSLASGDKIYRYGLFAVSALGNALQGWVLERDALRPYRRHCFAIVFHLLLGLAGLTFLCLFGSWATEFLFGDAVAAGEMMMICYGVAYFAVCASTPFVRNILVPAGRTKVVLLATLLGAFTGIPSMVFLKDLWGAAGVAAGLAASEALVLVVTVVASLPFINQLRHRKPILDGKVDSFERTGKHVLD